MKKKDYKLILHMFYYINYTYKIIKLFKINQLKVYLI